MARKSEVRVRILKQAALLLLLVLAEGTVFAQPPGTPSPGAALPPAPQQATPTRGAVGGVVLDRSGAPRQGVAIRLREDADSTGAAIRKPEAQRSTWITISDATGAYAFESLPAGYLRARVMGDFTAPVSDRILVEGGKKTTHYLVSRTRPYWISGLVFVGLLLYTSALLAFRHHNIVHANREHLAAQLENIATRIPLESDPQRSVTSTELKGRLEAIRTHLSTELTWKEWFFWSRGRELGGWSRLHEVERQLVAFLVPEARVIERSVTAEVDLRKLGSAAAMALADRMRATTQQILTATDNGLTLAPVHLLEHLKQQLAEALSILYTENDTKFSALMEWQNKAMWLVYLSCLVILLVGVVYHHEEVFLVGAAGGLMSRMTRSLFRADVPNDYGASWTTLFLSPLLGAIAAWFGIAVIMWAVDIGLLGREVFGRIDWNAGPDAIVIGIAFTLGFSERLFTSLLSTVEGRVVTAIAAPLPGGGPLGPTPGTPPAPGGGAQRQGVGAGEGSPQAGTQATEDQIVAELDLLSGERAAFIGDAASPMRDRMAQIVGVEHLFDVTAETVASAAPLDAVMVQVVPRAKELRAFAQRLRGPLRPEARVVVLGRSSTALFDADGVTQEAQDHAGPALVKEVLTAVAGLSSQEPPVVLNEGEPVFWMSVFVRSID